jgi:hypothetical protein
MIMKINKVIALLLLVLMVQSDGVFAADKSKEKNKITFNPTIGLLKIDELALVAAIKEGNMDLVREVLEIGTAKPTQEHVK